jgi:hypothetical protein
MIIRRLMWQAPLTGLAWLALLAGMSLWTDAAPAQVVIFPGPEFIAHLPPDIGIIGATGLTVTVAAPTPGLARILYAHGALLVLPARLTGCAA